jgi:hypothetical protein
MEGASSLEEQARLFVIRRTQYTGIKDISFQK